MIVLLGDSLSIGAFQSLRKRHPEAELFAKVGGSLSWMAQQVGDIASRAPKAVLVMGGTNDLVGLDVPATIAKLKKLVSDLEMRGLHVVVSTIPPQKTSNTQKVIDYNRAIVGGALGATHVVDVGGLITPDELSPDGVHPIWSHYPDLGNGWAEVVDGMFSGPPAASSGSGSSETSGVGTAVAIAAVAGVAWYLWKK